MDIIVDLPAIPPHLWERAAELLGVIGCEIMKGEHRQPARLVVHILDEEEI